MEQALSIARWGWRRFDFLIAMTNSIHKDAETDMRQGLPITRGQRRTAGEDGFGLLEVVLAGVLLMVILSAVGLTLASSLNLTRTNKNRTVAANLASEQVDQVRTDVARNFSLLTIGSTPLPSRTVGGATYTMTQDAQWITSTSSTDPCDTPPPSPSNPTTGLAYIRVTVSVKWPNMGGVNPVTAQTVVTPPVTTFQADTGHIPVQVFGDGGVPRSGVTIRVVAPSGTTYTQDTTAEGCAFFAFLPLLPGGQSYTVTADEPTYVDHDGDPAPSNSANVSIGATAPPLQFDYDQSGTLDLTLTGVDAVGAADPSVPLPVSQLPIVLGQSGLTGLRKSFPPGGVNQQIPGLFPFGDGYPAWIGECEDADPAAFPPEGRDEAHVAPALAVGVGVVRMPTVRIHVEDMQGFNAGPEVGKTVRAIHAPDGRCVAGADITLGVTDINGDVLVAMPFGQWTLQVDAQTAFSGTWPVETVQPPYDVKPLTIEVN